MSVTGYSLIPVKVQARHSFSNGTSWEYRPCYHFGTRLTHFRHSVHIDPLKRLKSEHSDPFKHASLELRDANTFFHEQPRAWFSLHAGLSLNKRLYSVTPGGCAIDFGDSTLPRAQCRSVSSEEEGGKAAESRRRFVVGATAADPLPRLLQFLSPRDREQPAHSEAEDVEAVARTRDAIEAEPLVEEREGWTRRMALAVAAILPATSPAAALAGEGLGPLLNPLPGGQPPAVATIANGTVAAAREQSESSTFGTQVLRKLGIGDADLFYPRVFEGTWDCISTLVAVETPQGEDMSDMRSIQSARRDIGRPLAYQARFMPAANGFVIADRLFTTKALVEATLGSGSIVSGEWDPQKPNRLTLTLAGGLKVENLVTKRSADASAAGQFDTSEYSKQVFDNRKDMEGPPSVKASRNLTRYRWDDTSAQVDEIEALQRISMFPLVGGAAGAKEGGQLSLLDVMSLNMGDKPTTIYKYFVKFVRHKE
eukprot:TRINITY_DN21100_c0_g1_i1.p1 TRINITY_DN21100_c0_g1~~TRINITY_DN21100_c0_g1_i1.p1  ORF type:complete len:482 (-),score=57.12 TRINITY_DN21100_c0_g1_i1:335-1780(-)